MNVESLEIQPGGKYHLTSEARDGWDGNLVGEVLEVDPPRKFVHTFNSNQLNYPMRVTWILEAAEDNSTLVTLTHSDFDKIGEAAKHARSIDGGWSNCMLELTNYINRL